MKDFLTFEFKVQKAENEDTTGVIEGYASTFGNVDLGYDIVERGAFLKSINDKRGKFPILLDHNPSKPIGWNTEAHEDEYGLKVRGEIQLITEEAKNRYALAKRALELGTKLGLSIGYSPVKWEFDADQPEIRRLKEIKLWEYSFVTFPMNTEALVHGVKSQRIGHAIEALQKSGYSDSEIEALLKQGIDHPKPKAAHQEPDPNLIQSVDDTIDRIKRALKT